MLTRILLILVLVTLLFIVQSNSALVFKMTNAVCESRNKSWVIIDTCRLHAVQRNKTILNIELTILHPTNSVTLRLQILRKANGYKPWIIDSTFDACKFVRNPKINPIGKMVYGLFEDFSSINHPCPYVGQQYLRGFYPIADRLSLVFPSGEYVLLMTWTFYKKIQFTTNVYFTFIEDYL